MNIRCSLPAFLPAAVSLLGVLFTGISACGQATPGARFALSGARPLSQVTLRGFGSVSGTYWTVPSLPGASLLQIDCADAAKAQLMQAKFLSDLGSLAGVTAATTTGRVKVQFQQVAGQGAVAALRAGSRVFIVTATNATDLGTLIDQTVMAKDAVLVSQAQVPVPMYLDRWDKFGWRFYYRPWEVPAGQTLQTYDIGKEFDWAKQQGVGLVFWDDMHALDTAEGLTNEVWWDWAAAAAKKQGIPVAINDEGGGSVNHDRDQTSQKMPQYAGDFYSIGREFLGGNGVLSWNATTAEDEALGQEQSSIRDYVNEPNVVSWLEPHGELNHGPQEIFTEYGPVADANYRVYLKSQHQTVAALSQRWFADPKRLTAWDQVHVPEVASFLGWGPQAIDLTGKWHVGYEDFKEGRTPSNWDLSNYGERKADTNPAPDAWYAPTFDDSAWPIVDAPGHDRTLFLPKRPAVYRRTFNVPTAWRSANPQVWLYVWDLNPGAGDTVRTALNGRQLPDSTTIFYRPHWMALDVSTTLQAGANSLAVRLPKGFLGYRMYLSPDAPRQYPNLGAARNAQWVDFSAWEQWARVQMVQRGMEMIRQVDPSRNITLMHPDDYADSIKAFAGDYGGEFHDTGFMGVYYADLDPMMMRGADLPVSVEPGSPASDLPGFKRMLGLYLSEGVQSVDYFIHIGDVLWHDDIRAYFEQQHNIVHLIGKYHAPKAKVAVLYASNISALTGYPWGNDPNVNLGSGYWSWNVAANLRDRYDRDGLTQSDFARGGAAAYPVVVDTNTSIMDTALVGSIEKYVRQGGTFITYAQTGRHTPLQRDAWPIARLTGYRVTHIDRLNDDGQLLEKRSLKIAAGQTVFTEDSLRTLNADPSNGLSLQPVASDTHALLDWPDGSVAVGYRKLGKGMIIQVGCKWTGSGMPDRIEPGSNSFSTKALTALLDSLMRWRGIAPIPGQMEATNEDVIMRHYVSNNGLYDVWTLWNQNQGQANTVDLVVGTGEALGSAMDVETGSALPLTPGANGPQLSAVTVQPLQTRVFLTPRRSLQTAGLDWFTLQRGWWRGTQPVSKPPLPAPTHRFNADLGQDWWWKPLPETQDAAALAGTDAADASWAKTRLGIYSVPDHVDVKNAVFRRLFEVPRTWTTGNVSLWLQSWYNTTFIDQGRVWLDGKMVRDWTQDGIAGDDLGGVLKPGTKHTLTVEVRGKGTTNGSRGTCWLAWIPAPALTLDLAGPWSPSMDCLRYTAPITLPGPYHAFALRRHITIPAQYAGKTAVLSADAPSPMVGVLINGHWVRRQHHMFGDRWNLNISPWVLPGKDNEIELVCWNDPGKSEVRSVRLNFYPAGQYP